MDDSQKPKKLSEYDLDELEDLTEEDIINDAGAPIVKAVRTLTSDNKEVVRKVTFVRAPFDEMHIFNEAARIANEQNDMESKKRYWQNLILKYSLKPKFESVDVLDKFGFHFTQHYGRLIEANSLKSPFL